MTPPRPRESDRTLVGPPPIPRLDQETPPSGTDLSDMQQLGPLGPHEAVRHLCARLKAGDDELVRMRAAVDRSAEQSRQAMVTADNTLTRLLEEVGPIKATSARIGDALFQLLPLPESMASFARSVVDLQKAVVRLDERLARTERRGESQNEIVERVAVLHLEDETTEVRARSLEVQRKHAARMVAIGWAKRLGKWLFAGGGAAIVGALLARECGG